MLYVQKIINYTKTSNVPYILLVPLCTVSRLYTYNLNKADQSQVRVQKRGVGYTFSRRYLK
jgi:hypothetical protein